MTLKLIGAGFGRTGTMSMKAALETLGLVPCYHMMEVFAHPEDALVWERAARGESVDFAALLKDWVATVDWPGCTFYRELMDIFPNAKVLLNVRDPDRWYESCRNTIYPMTVIKPTDLPEQLPELSPDGTLNPVLAPRRMINRLIWEKTFDNRFEDRAYALDVFNRHLEAVKQHVPPERLLVFDVKEGWEPLCAFLGVPVPSDQPFPRLNDTASFHERRGT